MPIGTTNFPASLDDASSLIRVANRASSTVGTGGVDASSTTIPVASAAAAPQDGVCLIGEEIILYTGKTATSLTGCTRGYDSSVAASHAEGVPVYFDIIIADHHSVHTDAIVAVETKLGAGSSTPSANTYLAGADDGTSSWESMPNPFFLMGG